MTDQVPEQQLPQMAAAPPERDIAAELAAKQAAAQQQINQDSQDSGRQMFTGADVAALIEGIQREMAAMKAQMTTLQASQGPQGVHPLLSVARQLRYHLGDMQHADSHASALQLADDLVDAAGNAIDSGNLDPVHGIAARLGRWLDRNPVPPGESYHARQAADIIRYHLGDQTDNFVPRPKAPAIESDRAPARVIPGSVTG